jgi:acylphosphatase
MKENIANSVQVKGIANSNQNAKILILQIATEVKHFCDFIAKSVKECGKQLKVSQIVVKVNRCALYSQIAIKTSRMCENIANSVQVRGASIFIAKSNQNTKILIFIANSNQSKAFCVFIANGAKQCGKQLSQIVVKVNECVLFSQIIIKASRMSEHVANNVQIKGASIFIIEDSSQHTKNA